MGNSRFTHNLKEASLGLFLAVLIGLAGYYIKVMTQHSLVDPLLVAMVIGIIVRTAIQDSERFSP